MRVAFGLLAIIGALSSLSFAPHYSVDEVIAALRSGNVAELARYFDERVDLSLPDRSDNYSKNQAAMILKDFLSNNPVKDFQVKHKGESNGSEFCFGILITRTGSYRTKLYMKMKGDRQVLQELGFQLLD